MILLKKFLYAIPLVFVLAVSIVQSQQQAEEPQVLFERMLEEANASDTNMRSAVANYFLTIPERSGHEKSVKAVLANEFKEKYGITIEDALQAPPPSEQSWWSKYQQRIINFGVPALVAAVVGAIMYSKRAATPVPGRLTSDQQTLVDAVNYFTTQGSPTSRRRGG